MPWLLTFYQGAVGGITVLVVGIVVLQATFWIWLNKSCTKWHDMEIVLLIAEHLVGWPALGRPSSGTPVKILVLAPAPDNSGCSCAWHFTGPL